MRLSSRLRSSLLADQELIQEEVSEGAGDSKADSLQPEEVSNGGKRH